MNRLISQSAHKESNGTLNVSTHHNVPHGLFLYHGNKDSPRASSLMSLDGNVATHSYTNKGNGTIDEIHQNFEHMLRNGYEVRSSTMQSKGGRNLWVNIHKRFPDREIGIVQNGVNTQLNDLTSHLESNDKSVQFYIK